VFPAAKGNFSSVPWWNELSDCGKKDFQLSRGGAMLYFFGA